MTHDNEEPSGASGGSVVCPYVTGTVTRYCTLTPLTLTDAEREAVAWAERFARSQRDSRDKAADYAAALRGLLERTQ